MANLKIKLHCCIIVFLGLCLSTFAQTPIYQWANSISGTSFKTSTGIALDSSNNVYTEGSFQGTVDFDPDTALVFNLTAIANDDIFITKQNNQGQFLWAKKIGGSNQDYAKSIAIDSLGNIFISGTFKGTVDFDPGNGVFNLSAGSITNSFICKLNANGNFIWAKKLGSAYNETNDLTLDAHGNMYACGLFNNTVDFDPNGGVFNLTAQSFASDIFILKLNQAGNLIWAKSFSGFNDEFAYGIAVDQQGNVFTTGNFYGTVDFDTGLNNYNLTSTNPLTSDIFIAKLDSAGNFMWAVSYGDSLGDYGYKITTDSQGNCYTVGGFIDTVDFDLASTNYTLISDQGARNGFILKLNATGNTLWANGLIGLGDLVLMDINLDALENIYITGNLSYTADFDPGPATYSLYSEYGPDLVIAKYFKNGTFDWAKNIGGSNPGGGGAYGNAIVTDQFQNAYITGGFSPQFDFDIGPNIQNLTAVLANVADIFTLKLGPCIPTFASQTFSFCQGQVVTVGNNVYFNSGVYTDTLFNTTGCDSIVVTDLTVFSIYDSLQNIYLCPYDSILIGGVYHNTTGVFIDTIMDIHGCTNTITTSLTVFAPINVSVTVNNTNLIANYAGAANFQWLDCNTYTPIAGATSQIFIPTANGNYAVLVSNPNCMDTSSCFSFLTVDLMHEKDNLNVNLYPNPISNELVIELNEMRQFESYIITNTLGQQLIKGVITELKTTLQFKNLPNGMYNLQLMDKVNSQQNFKLIKQ